MLGEQLIKSERIALVELIKNSYDADATRVEVDFRGFDAALSADDDATIVITDNGSGMSQDVITSVWMNPATPAKAIAKRGAPRTPRGRIIQGEKGIGRFASFKLGNKVSLISKRFSDRAETRLDIDIASLDEENPSSGSASELFLDEVLAVVSSAEPSVFSGHGSIRSLSGTQLTIGGLRATWSRRLIENAFDDLDRMQPLMWDLEDEAELRAGFSVVFLRDGEDMDLGRQRGEEFQATLERAVLKVTDGRFDVVERAFSFMLNGRPVELRIDDAEIRGLRVFRSHFLSDTETLDPNPSCGSFGFEFYIFDFSRTAPSQHQLDDAEKSLLKRHRVYLYRDGIRVYPYGDPDDDWLQVDVIRGTQSARSMFSNDQTVGFVTISQDENPNLRDKTNREGLLESGDATGDFVALIQTVLSYLRSKPYERYSLANRRIRERALERHQVDQHVEVLRSRFGLPERALEQLDRLEVAVQAERDLARLQVARTEQLAGVGLSVETASHDLIAAGTEALRQARHVVAELRLLDLIAEPVFAVASALVSRLQFIVARFQDVQGLFVSTRQKQTELEVIQLLRRVRSMYGSLHQDKKISFEIDDQAKLRAVTTEAAALQCLINLVDNATYWLMASPYEPRLIRAFCPSSDTLAITDNGPGVAPQDEPFIFEAFYSGKGDEGKGLGLYIARQNGLRSGFDVDLKRSGDERELDGATFLVRFREPRI